MVGLGTSNSTRVESSNWSGRDSRSQLGKDRDVVFSVFSLRSFTGDQGEMPGQQSDTSV